MALEESLTIMNSAIGVLGLGGVGGLVIALWKGGAFSEARKRDLKETNTKFDTAISGINTKLDGIKEDVSGKIDSIKKDVADVKHDIRNGGLKEAISAMQTSCGSQMARVATQLEDHCKLAGHPGVTEKLAELEARIDNVTGK